MALIAAVAARGASPRPTVQAKRPTDASTALRAALERGWRRYRSELAASRAKLGRKAAHRLRKKARELETFLLVLGSCTEFPSLAHALGALQRQLDAVGRLRDAQVEHGWLRRLGKRRRMKEAFDWMRAREARRQKKAEKALACRDLEDAMKSVFGQLRYLGPDARADADLRFQIDNAWSNWRAEALSLAFATKADLRSLHEARIALRRFLCLDRALPQLRHAMPRSSRKALRSRVALMGKIHDLDRVRRTLARGTRRKALPGAVARPIRDRVVRKRATALRDYLEQRTMAEMRRILQP